MTDTVSRNTAAPGEEPTIVDRFKAAFRNHPAGVAVVTTQGPDGPVGLTASSVASVSADPPVLVFSVTTSAGSAGTVLTAPTFVVNLLRSEHVDIAKSFAVHGSPRFTPEQGFSTRHSGEPVLSGAAVALWCRPLQTVPVGASTLIVAEVLDVELGEPGSPLVYHDRTFHGLGGHTILT
ncbi:flavin reductase family protein [Plantibacter sp. YIM 135347]|uniref:flavin reductase family protein n=1 Tax=Plantibacter sp. YIM 135347 TaxID=3423919 RepID=UPI003D3482E5